MADWQPASRRCRWGVHRWRPVDAMHGLWSLVDQCERCESWQVTNVITETVNVYPPHRGRVIHG